MIGWPFRKAAQLPPGPVPDWPPAPPAPADRRGWSEDWQIGDLAECRTGVQWIITTGIDPQPGDILRVTALREGIDMTATVLVSALGFAGKPAGLFWAQSAFRKLRPALDAAEDSFTADLRDRLRIPVGGGAHAGRGD